MSALWAALVGIGLAAAAAEWADVRCKDALTAIQAAVTDTPATSAVQRAVEAAENAAVLLRQVDNSLGALAQISQAAQEAVDTETARLRAGGS